VSGVRGAADRTSREAAPNAEQLKTYSRLKLSLASQLRALRGVLKQGGHERRERQYQSCR
jgi:hypothetical protein